MGASAGDDASIDGSGGALGPTSTGDAGPAFISFADSSTTQAFNCKPGTYTGPFSTKVGSGTAI
jgi:hypothetical protein